MPVLLKSGWNAAPSNPFSVPTLIVPRLGDAAGIAASAAGMFKKSVVNGFARLKSSVRIRPPCSPTNKNRVSPAFTPKVGAPDAPGVTVATSFSFAVSAPVVIFCSRDASGIETKRRKRM